MNLEVFANPEAVAREAAAVIAADARTAVAQRGRFTLAVSGGRTPWLMLHALAASDVPWNRVHLFQVDERVVPEGDPERNLTHIRECLLDCVPIRVKQVHAMPVGASDLEAAAAQYMRTIRKIAGVPPVLDLVHLGLGLDGHTASLVSGDPVLTVTEADVALTRDYLGKSRMTLTFPLLYRARRIVWVVTGAEKAAVLTRLCEGDESIPAGRVRRDRAMILADSAAAELAVGPTRGG